MAEIADLMKRDDDPAFQLLPDLKNIEFKIESNAMHGWTLAFPVDAASESMRSFGRSGELRYRLDKVTRRYGSSASKDDAAAFVKRCAKK
ncbi:hypothetical protein IY145_14905 [Methylosinus sp. H3A]|uniref:hypothetical protein n=1 Tax=Methylosinus sp. H3A TaxID=2785786 RepID=UPI0018C251D5|nr:hypothetical protein [Methylosinus sp. H3A]MBG0810659.1 hypothetical protein [Methylosinus sp. H3A]